MPDELPLFVHRLPDLRPGESRYTIFKAKDEGHVRDLMVEAEAFWKDPRFTLPLPAGGGFRTIDPDRTRAGVFAHTMLKADALAPRDPEP